MASSSTPAPESPEPKQQSDEASSQAPLEQSPAIQAAQPGPELSAGVAPAMEPQQLPERLPLKRRLRDFAVDKWRRWMKAPALGVSAKVCRFSAFAWPGAVIGAIVVNIAYATWMSYYLQTGIPRFLDVALGMLSGALAIGLLGLAFILVAMLLRKCFSVWPKLFTGGFFAGVFSLVVLFGVFGAPGPTLFRFTLPPIALGAVFGAGLAVALRRPAGKVYRYVGWVMALLGLALAFALGWWLHSPGSDQYIELQSPVPSVAVPQISAPNPSLPGTYNVRSLFYGSGNDKRRAEFGPGVALKTAPVDARKLLKGWDGFKAKARKWYWGFGPREFPLNARVWYPEGDGPFPLVLIVHGNHQMAEYSDPGYAYLGELLASRGFILASIDENFMNGSWIGGFSGENGVRGWLLLKHLETWRQWNQTQGNVFYHKVDMEKVALMGHSRGGEAIVHAAAFNRLERFPDNGNEAFNFGFSIKALVAIAPIDGQYEPANEPAPIENVNYLVLQGSHDADVSFYAGYRPFRRLRFNDRNYYFKAGLLTYRANHGQFNTVWGSFDSGQPVNLMLNQKPVLLEGGQQRQVAKVYIAGFLEATLHGNNSYIPMFRDHRAAAPWLPKTIYLNQFEDSNYRAVSDFEKTIDLNRTTVAGGREVGENLTLWRQQDMKARNDWNFRKKGVLLGWDSEEKKSDDAKAATRDNKTDQKPKIATYSIILPDNLARDWRLNANASLFFSAADTGEDPHPKEAVDDPPETAKPEADKAKEKDKAAKDKGKEEKKDKSKEKPEPIDFTLELVAADGTTARLPLSAALSPIQPILKVRWTKWDYIENDFYKKPGEAVFQTFEVPLSLFTKAEPKFDPARLKTVRLCFDRTKKGVIAIDSLGFRISSQVN